MRIGKEWKTIKNEFQNELTEKQKQLLIKWLYCPVSLKFQEKQIILEVFKLLNINQFEKKQTLFSNEKLLNDFQNYIKKYANSAKKIFQINLKKKKKKNKTMTKKNNKKNENKNDNFKIKSIQINKFILCLRSNLFREMIFQTFPIQSKIEKVKEKEKKN
ncbi:hypothetical protein M0812_22803 [Anaeramoeba flamelloides]|uniref:BTB domain-containing protein n=1 Tax=Anaeramoeba flamelloides TaxID=1746091 RepID=A0AAV7YYR2_9EUKA|nr:hypothetical protein M0812_22803 [Anaeramoeba flamelloides]